MRSILQLIKSSLSYCRFTFNRGSLFLASVKRCNFILLDLLDLLANRSHPLSNVHSSTIISSTVMRPATYDRPDISRTSFIRGTHAFLLIDVVSIRGEKSRQVREYLRMKPVSRNRLCRGHKRIVGSE